MKFFRLSSIGAHIALVSFLLGLLAALVVGIDRSLALAESTIRPSLDVTVFLQSSLPEDVAKGLGDQLKAKDPAIESFTYISREQAARDAGQDPMLAKSMMILKENPFPSAYVFHYNDSAWMDRAEPTEGLSGFPGIQEIRWDARARSNFRMVHQWREWILRFGEVAAALVMLWALFGAYRFLAQRAPFVDLLKAVVIGCAGGALALVAWAMGMRHLGHDASMTMPMGMTWWPLWVGIACGIAFFGIEKNLASN